MPILKEFRHHSPKNLSEALNILEENKTSLVLAGGTFVLNTLKKITKYPSDVVSLKKIAGLKGVKKSKQGVVIGAMTTISELSESEVIQNALPSLFKACQQLATTPLRNMATIGGNVASRFFWVDLPAVLISLGAKVVLATAKGKKTLSVEEFLRHPPSTKFILTSIVLAVLAQKKPLVYYFRHTKTMDVDIPYLALACSADQQKDKLRDVRLIMNTALSFPVELKNTQSIFEAQDAQKINLALVKEALRKDLEKTKLDDYRRHCLEADLESLVMHLKGSHRAKN